MLDAGVHDAVFYAELPDKLRDGAAGADLVDHIDVVVVAVMDQLL